MNDMELDKQVEEFEYFYNNVDRLVDGDKFKPMPPLTEAQKEFVKYLTRCKAKGFNPLNISTRLRYIKTYEISRN